MNHIGSIIRGKLCALFVILLWFTSTGHGQTGGGTVVAWGDNSFGQSTVPSGLTNVVAISAGYDYSLALKADGTVVGWGNQPAPIPDGLSNITAIASGVIFSLALQSDGVVVGWGDDTYGQIDVPTGLSNVVAIATGVEHSIALKNDGTVVAWGYDSDGQIDVPAGLSNVVAVAGGNYHTLALMPDGSVLSWGGDGGGFSMTSSGLSDVVAIAGEYYASVALTADGSVYSWSEATPVDQAGLVDGFTNIIAIAAFYDHFMALKNDGTVMISGSDTFGGIAVPADLGGVIGIATGGQHGLALIGNGAVTIVQQPVPRTLYSGMDATFSVGAIGTPPLNYQWQLGGANLAGATNSLLTISNAQPSDMGAYRVVVTGPVTNATSASAVLSLLLTPPIITLQPVGQDNWLGASTTFTAAATGSQPLYYQWQFNETNLDGATNSILNLTNLQISNQGFYSLVVSNAYGVTNSSIVPLTIGGLAEALNATNLIWQTYGDVLWTVSVGNWAHDGVAAAVSSAPSPGQKSILQTIVTGPGTLSFWWKVDQPAYWFSFYLAVNGAIQPLTSPGMTWQQQTVYIGAGTNLLQWVYTNSGPYVSNIGSWLDQVSYVPGGTAPMITAIPGNQTQPAGTNVTFNVTANGTPPFSYQWLFNGASLAGATNASYNFYLMGTNQAGGYSVIITNYYGSITSSIATLTVLVTPPGIISQPASQTVRDGSNVTFNVVAAGSPPLNYQWLFNGALLNGQTNSTLSLPNVTTNQAGAYSVWVASPFGSITSHIATLTVGWRPSITMQPTNQSVLGGSRALIVAGVSGVGPLTFQWQLNGTNLPNNLITTIAGNGTVGFAGDGGLATAGEVYSAYGVDDDGSGDVFIADGGNQRIRKVDASGIITTVVGDGFGYFWGDNGPATNAEIYNPHGVAADGMGNVFIADTYNNRIRKVDTNGIITTVVGQSSRGFSGDGGPATSASLYYPYGVLVDTNGNLFVADTYNSRIRKVDTNGIITTVAGKSSSGFSGDGGAATNASLYRPQSVAMDGNGNLLIADTSNSRVRQVDVYGVITTIAGNGSSTYSGDNGVATNAGMNPYGVSVDGYGDVLIADRSNNRIRRVDPYGIITTVAGTNAFGFNGDGMVATNALLYNPSGVAMDSYGRFLIADTLNSRIRRFGQGPTLVFDKLAVTNAGNYKLVVSSSYGSVTSSVATLTVLLSPTIVSQPTSQTAGLGSNATFNVTATGILPLAYQWQMSGTNLPNQTSQSLNFSNVRWSDAGNYAVIITNNYGSVTSSVATLTVVVPPSVSAFMVTNGTFNFTWNAQSNFTYQMQCATNLVAPNWNDIGSPITATNGSVTESDVLGPDNQRFYRLKLSW
jgi:alpha-tubulin suppressor-like RCC1 family protein/sugar lactone lactonase YvrE